MQTVETIEDVIATGGLMPHQPPPETEERTHRVACPDEDCDKGALIRQTASGGGFFVLERINIDPDTSIGIGENSLPVCPKHDVEMVYADEQIPVGEAFAAVAGSLAEAQQKELPGILPPFNWEGAGRDMCQQSLRVEALKKIYDEKNTATKEAKKQWEDAEELLTKMGVEYARRSQSGDEPAETEEQPAPPTLVRCLFEAQNAAEICPLCNPDTDPRLIAEAVGEVASRDAQGHLEQVVRFYDEQDVEMAMNALENVLIIDRAVVRGWTVEQRHAVIDWTFAKLEDPNAKRPEVLGTSHIAAETAEGVKFQVCRECDDTILVLDGDTLPYETGLPVGTDCKGPGQHYPVPETSPAKKQARKKKAAGK